MFQAQNQVSVKPLDSPMVRPFSCPLYRWGKCSERRSTLQLTYQQVGHQGAWTLLDWLEVSGALELQGEIREDLTHET